jgi:hypothetical protein
VGEIDAHIVQWVGVSVALARQDASERQVASASAVDPPGQGIVRHRRYVRARTTNGQGSCWCTDIGHHTFVRRREAADRMLRYAMRKVVASTGLYPETARCVTCKASGSAPLGHFCSSAIFPSVFPDSESAVELRDAESGAWVTTTMLLPRSSTTLAELQLLRQFAANALLVRPMIQPMSAHQDGSQAGRVVHRGFQCATVGRRQKV